MVEAVRYILPAGIARDDWTRSLYEEICDVAKVAPEGRVILLRCSYESTPSPRVSTEHYWLCHRISASWLTTVLNSTEIFPRSSCHLPWHWTFSCFLYDSTPQTALFHPPVPGSRLGYIGIYVPRCLENTRTTRKITEWTPYKTRPAGRPRLRWMDQVEEDLKRMTIIGWKAKVEDRQEWNRIVEKTKTHPGL